MCALLVFYSICHDILNQQGPQSLEVWWTRCTVLLLCSVQQKYKIQKAVHKLNQIITEYGLTISVQKTKSMAFKGRDPVRTKIVIDNKVNK